MIRTYSTEIPRRTTATFRFIAYQALLLYRISPEIAIGLALFLKKNYREKSPVFLSFIGKFAQNPRLVTFSS